MAECLAVRAGIGTVEDMQPDSLVLPETNHLLSKERPVTWIAQLRRQLVPVTLRGQITLVILFAVVLVVTTGRLTERFREAGPLAVANLDATVERVWLLADLMASATSQERDWLVERTRRTGLDVRVMDRPALRSLIAASEDRHELERWIFRLFPPDAQPGADGGWEIVDGRPFFWTKVDGSTVLVAPGLPPMVETSDFVGPLTYYFLAFGTLVVLFSVYAARSVADPVARIVDELDRSDGISPDCPIEERGTIEIVRLAQALNAMRARARAMIETRMRMLRSVSHDLRTPLTRLRLRAERLDDLSLRQAFVADIGQVDAMVAETLDYLRSDAVEEDVEDVDIASLLQTIEAEFTDVGFAVRYFGPDRLTTRCRPVSLTRAVNNLCDNALKFGREAVVTLSRPDNEVWIEVSDDGPGIPRDKRSLVLEPFYKVDSARSSAHASGFGLGLSIVSDIVSAHGGRLEFLDGRARGLTVRIRLPNPPPSTMTRAL